MEPTPTPDLTTRGQDYVFTWPSFQAEVTVRDIASGRDGPRAEVWAKHEVVGHLHASMLNLMSTSSKQTYIKAVLSRDGASNWADMIEQVCVLATEAYRDGDPLTLIEPERRPEAGRFALEPLIPLGQPTLWFGDGKSGKSYMALAAARAIQLGESLAGKPTEPMTIAYLDWEWDADEHKDRLLRLGGDVTLFYRSCQGALKDSLRQLERSLSQHSVDLAIVDSLGLACGGDPRDPGDILSFFGALRYLCRTSLVIHHVPKDSKEPFGSVYVKNSARSAWYVVRSMLPDPSGFTCAFQHRATNSRYQPAQGFKLTFDEEAYTTEIEPTNPKDMPELAAVTSKKELILNYLKDNPGSRAEDIADFLDEPLPRVYSHLSQMKQQQRVNNRDARWSLSAKQYDDLNSGNGT